MRVSVSVCMHVCVPYMCMYVVLCVFLNIYMYCEISGITGEEQTHQEPFEITVGEVLSETQLPILDGCCLNPD